MGVKDLWTILTPYSERKPINELRGKTIAIDLAGWVCESLNVVDYYVHPRHHLKNLFFRTCYLIWEDVTPIFVLEGVAPKLKSQVIAKRNELQFRGVKPRNKQKSPPPPPTQTESSSSSQVTKEKDKGRTRFNHVLKQCENLLQTMGIQCVQAPGEAEAYCAFLNKKGFVDGVISQDSDCFAYGALCVYRNFSVSTQGAQAAPGGAVDIYNMPKICSKMLDFGQNKIIVMALLCGCDYCPDGIGGVGRDGVLKLFAKYKNREILDRLRSWRNENDKYTALEMRVDDKTICSNCGHIGRTQSHTKNGCGICRTHRGCNETAWKEERLALKAELQMRKKALLDPTFPNEEIIEEFLSEPSTIPQLTLAWNQPNIVKFIKQMCRLLEWTEIYAFQKFFPILTRWQVKNAKCCRKNSTAICYVELENIIKKRTIKGVPSLELIWSDSKGFFQGLIPDEQLKEFVMENSTGLQELWTTVEPLEMMEIAYPEPVETFIKSKEKKSKKIKKNSVRRAKKDPLGSSLENFQNLITATDEVAKAIEKTKTKGGRKKATATKVINAQNGVQMIDRFFKQNSECKNPTTIYAAGITSTPNIKLVPSDLENDSDDDDGFNFSAIINGMIQNCSRTHVFCPVKNPTMFDPQTKQSKTECNPSLDDLDILVLKSKSLSTSQQMVKDDVGQRPTKRIAGISLDDTFDMLVNQPKKYQLENLIKRAKKRLSTPKSHVERFKEQHHPTSLSPSTSSTPATGNACRKTARLELNFTNVEHNDAGDSIRSTNGNVSYFFDNDAANNSNAVVAEDAFEQLMEYSLTRKWNKTKDDNNDDNDDDPNSKENVQLHDDLVLISDSSDNE